MQQTQLNEQKQQEKLYLYSQVEWWRPTQFDNYDLEKKLKNVGCRPLQRKLLECKAQHDQNDFKECDKIQEQLNECQKILDFVQATNKSII